MAWPSTLSSTNTGTDPVAVNVKRKFVAIRLSAYDFIRETKCVSQSGVRNPEVIMTTCENLNVGECGLYLYV